MASFLNGRSGFALASIAAPFAAAAAANAAVVTVNYVVTNTSNSTQTFVYEQNIGALLGPSSIMTGSVTGTVTDLNGDGAEVTTVGQVGSIYTALIDGVGVRGLLGPGFSFNAGQFLSSTSGSDSFTAEPGPGVNSQIGIRFEFTLTAGDSASFTSIFTVNAVPAPGAIGLLAVAGLVGLRRRRN
ncbi:MAG: hypothetical protein U0574_12400 [Phycisphaerales bacterium]